MKREDLIEILNMDGTLQQMQEAVAEKELTEHEYEKIFEFLESEQKDRCDKLFDDIFRDVENIPVQGNLKELLNWGSVRRDLENEIKELKYAELEAKDEIAKLGDKIEELKQEYEAELLILDESLKNNEISEKVYNSNKQAIDDSFEYAESRMKKDISNIEKDLEIESKQVSALSLMHSYAKTQEAQIRGQVFAETVQPVVKALKREWTGLGDLARDVTQYVRDSKEHIKNARDARKSAEDLNFHPIETLKNKIGIAFAKYHIANYNDHSKDIKDLEDKLLKKANAIVMKEFRKDQRIQSRENFGRGKPVDVKVNKDDLEIKDIEKAKEILREKQWRGDKRVDKAENSLNKLVKKRDKENASAKKRLANVQTRLVERRKGVIQENDRILEDYKRGDLGKANYSMNVIAENLDQALDKTYFDFSKDITDFMKEQGIEDRAKRPEPIIENEPEPINTDGKTPEEIGTEIEAKFGENLLFIIGPDGQILDATYEDVKKFLEEYVNVDIKDAELTFSSVEDQIKTESYTYENKEINAAMFKTIDDAIINVRESDCGIFVSMRDDKGHYIMPEIEEHDDREEEVGFTRD